MTPVNRVRNLVITFEVDDKTVSLTLPTADLSVSIDYDVNPVYGSSPRPLAIFHGGIGHLTLDANKPGYVK